MYRQKKKIGPINYICMGILIVALIFVVVRRAVGPDTDAELQARCTAQATATVSDLRIRHKNAYVSYTYTVNGEVYSVTNQRYYKTRLPDVNVKSTYPVKYNPEQPSEVHLDGYVPDSVTGNVSVLVYPMVGVLLLVCLLTKKKQPRAG